MPDTPKTPRARYQDSVQQIQDRLDVPQSEGGLMSPEGARYGRPEISRQAVTPEGLQTLRHDLQRTTGYSNAMTNLWSGQVDPQFVRENRYVHWIRPNLDVGGDRVRSFLQQGLQGIAQGEINTMVYPPGSALMPPDSGPFAGGVGIIIEGDVRYISNTDTGSFPKTFGGNQSTTTGVSGEQRYLLPNREGPQALALRRSDLYPNAFNSPGPMWNEAVVNDFRIKAVLVPPGATSGSLGRVRQVLGRDAPVVSVSPEDPSRLIPADSLSQRIHPNLAQIAESGSSRVARPRGPTEEVPGGQQTLFRPDETPHLGGRAAVYSAPGTEAPSVLPDIPHPDQLFLDPEWNPGADRVMYGNTGRWDIPDFAISEGEKDRLRALWEGGSRDEINRSLIELGVIDPPSMESLRAPLEGGTPLDAGDLRRRGSLEANRDSMHRILSSETLGAPQHPGPAQQELFATGEIGGAQGPEDLQARGSTMAPDDLPPASTPFPERSPGSLTAERNAAAARALQADRARRSARLSAVGRGAGALAVGADAALLGYNTVQQGDPLRGAMETGAQTVEGVGSILRAPQAGLEMAGINPPPWANPLQQISEAGDMLTETMGPYRRWQEREARIRENTPDRVTQQRESRNAAVSRALAPKE